MYWKCIVLKFVFLIKYYFIALKIQLLLTVFNKIKMHYYLKKINCIKQCSNNIK